MKKISEKKSPFYLRNLVKNSAALERLLFTKSLFYFMETHIHPSLSSFSKKPLLEKASALWNLFVPFEYGGFIKQRNLTRVQPNIDIRLSDQYPVFLNFVTITVTITITHAAQAGRRLIFLPSCLVMAVF